VPPERGDRLPLPDFSGRRALVTGSAHGIGLAVGRLLRGLGAAVIAVDSDETELRAAFPAGECDLVVADVASDPVVLGDRLVAEHGPISLVVNNVGITTPSRFLDLEPDEFDRVFSTNLRAGWFLTRQLVRELVTRETAGSVLFISSVHDTFVRLNPHYSASKAAVAMLVKELAFELAPHRIRVNAIAPGWIKTHETVDPEHERTLVSRIPAGRPGHPNDVAGLAAILLSDELTGYVTGTSLTVDGGLSLYNWRSDLDR
jgi:NAD(P)-dependent dehydrogenase (short-subunit alcohol dehydrogenase family)